MEFNQQYVPVRPNDITLRQLQTRKPSKPSTVAHSWVHDISRKIWSDENLIQALEHYMTFICFQPNNFFLSWRLILPFQLPPYCDKYSISLYISKILIIFRAYIV